MRRIVVTTSDSRGLLTGTRPRASARQALQEWRAVPDPSAPVARGSRAHPAQRDGWARALGAHGCSARLAS
jgi:hypothetical protein